MKNELIQIQAESFEGVISNAKTACELSGHGIANHFANVGKMIQLGKYGQHKTSDPLHKAWDFVTEITIHNPSTKNLRIEPQVSQAHVTNNEAVRQTLLSRGIRPESLPPAEDVKKVERRLTSAEKKALKNPEGLVV